MNWGNVATVALVALVLMFGWLRVERRRRLAILLILIGPTCFLTYRWAAYRDEFAETWTGFGIALLVAFVWWLVYGRKHPPGSSDSIKVWGQEDEG